MFGFHKKKTNEGIYAPLKGTYIEIDAIPDEVFSKKMLGNGFAIIPEHTQVFSPVYGEIMSVFPTKHAISIRTNQKNDVIVHMGLETVELNGEPFELFVKVGDKVTPKTKLAEIDLEKLAQEKYDASVIVVFPTVSEKKLLLMKKGKVSSGENVGEIIV